MRRIRSSDTSVELMLRRELRKAGLLGYRVHPRGLVGTPDVVYSRWKLAVFVDGCFWHACPKCYVAPSSNTEYWGEKRERNRRRDLEVDAALRREGWRVLRLWEHEVRADPVNQARRVAEELEIAGR